MTNIKKYIKGKQYYVTYTRRNGECQTMGRAAHGSKLIQNNDEITVFLDNMLHRNISQSIYFDET